MARRFYAEQLVPEHVIIALLKDGAGLACKALSFLRIDLPEFRQSLEKELPRQIGALVMGDLPPAKRTRTLLENAATEAGNIGDDYIGTEHLLFAAAAEPNALTKLYLSQRAVDADMLRVLIQTNFRRRGSRDASPGSRRSDAPSLDESRTGEREVYPGEEFKALVFRPDGEEEWSRQRFRTRKKDASASTPALDEFCQDLSALAREGKLDPVVGRQKEIDRAIRILARRSKNNPVLVGEPGVGKTAIVEGLAQYLAGEFLNESLAGQRVLSLDLGAVVAGTKYRGEFEERIKKILREIQKAGDIILFIDEIHTMIGAGSAEGTLDASNMLKPALSRGEFRCIGATTLAEYRKYIAKDGALERRFQAVLVEEPGPEDTLAILQGLQKRYEEYHRVRYSPEAIQAVTRLSRRYITGRSMPDKAIDVLDEAGALRKLETSSRQPPELVEIERELRELDREKQGLISAQNYEAALLVRNRLRQLRHHLGLVQTAWERAARNSPVIVSGDDIRRVIAEATGIPLERLGEGAAAELRGLEAELSRRVIGQSEAIARLAASLRRSRSGLASPKRPLGSFIFLGPTGVGKTLLAKELTARLFGSEDALVRIDMSDYLEKHQISRLVGAPPGYVGYDEGGLLTEKIRRNPYRVVLFDEIEKAHQEVFNMLLQVLEEGELRDSQGRAVNFRNTVIIMTSNAGAREISWDNRLGFGVPGGPLGGNEIKNAALAELRRLFNPEFLNRIDEMLIFRPLDQSQAEAILKLQTEELSSRLAEQGYSLTITAGARRFLAQKGWDLKNGARPMRRTLQKELEDPLAMLLLEGSYPAGTVFAADYQDGHLSLHAETGFREAEEKALCGVIDAERRV
jgi:ATP-dependent Clp protease ATP-binding subunit ClpC